MPIYEYRCESCDHEMEALQKMSDEALVKCPECGKSTLKKLVSAPGFRLKGGGWYETDFKSKNRKNVVQESKSGKGGDQKSEAKQKSSKNDKSAGSSEGKGKSTD